MKLTKITLPNYYYYCYYYYYVIAHQHEASVTEITSQRGSARHCYIYIGRLLSKRKMLFRPLSLQKITLIFWNQIWPA